MQTAPQKKSPMGSLFHLLAQEGSDQATQDWSVFQTQQRVSVKLLQNAWQVAGEGCLLCRDSGG